MQDIATQLSSAVSRSDGEAVAQHLLRPYVGGKFNNDVEGQLASDFSVLTRSKAQWSAFVQAHFAAAASLPRDAAAASRHQATAHSAFLQLFRSEQNGRWLVPVLKVVNAQSRSMATLADRQIAASGGVPDRLATVVGLLQQEFTALNMDRSALETSKKWAALDIANNLFKIYFKQRNGDGFRGVLDSLKNIPKKSTFPAAEYVTFRFYVGRLRLMQEKFTEAEASLVKAYRRCPPVPVNKNNRRVIMLFLCAARLALGQIPPPSVIKQHGLEEHFTDLVLAIQLGNIREYRRILDENQDVYVQLDIFLALDKAKTMAYRNLFRRCWVLMGKSTKLHLDPFVAILKWLGEELDADEVACLLASLIEQDLIKGYVSVDGVRALVLSSRGDPFARD